MSKKTRLMSKLFSESTPAEYKEIIAEKVDEALANGKAEYSDENGEDLTFQAVDGDVLVADHNGDEVEVTRVSANPEDENDLLMEAAADVEVHTEEEPTPEPENKVESETEDPIKLCPETHMFYIEGKEEKYPTYAEAKEAMEKAETKTESEDQNLKSIEISVLPGEGIEPEADIVDDLAIEIDPDVVGTQRYSMRFKNFSEKKAKMIAKLFATSTEALEKMVNCDVDEDVQVKFEGEKLKVMSVTIGKPARTFSATEEPTEEPTEAPTEEPKGEVKVESEDEFDAIDTNNDGLISKEEWEAAGKDMTQFDAIDTNKDGMIDKDEFKASLTSEVTKTESETEPKVTLTIENLEPASIGDLLTAGQDEPKEQVEPQINPNHSDFEPKHFSVTRKESAVNPLLTTEIH